MIIESFPDRIITVEGKKHLYFGGTSYLGIATNNEFQNILITSLKKWGTAYGSSRNSNIKLSIYNQFEQLFSQHINSEASLAISSGMLAGKFTLDFLSKTIKLFFHYPKAHPAILTPNSLPLFVDGKLHPNLQNNTIEEVVITADAVLSLEVTPTSFDFLNKISSSKKITLVIDESHSLGVVGENGRGIFHTVQNNNIYRKIMVSSLGKALGLSMGIISADKKFIEALKKEANFIAASGANPAYLETYIQAQNLYKTQRLKLKSNLDFINKKLSYTKKYNFNKNYPVIYSNDNSVFATLLKDKIMITQFKYPTYKNYLNRIVITANHTKEDLEKLTIILKEKL
ncbi:MAG: aminotransferase class I/II-fold pyridoxal phosphate-dependent enzyme [Flavobacteriaceae bacterium]|nr:aminotransferase class I/II-fold pyridoxal phosphate-dependent enzyme [Flavobacteriaceae bacterium]